MQPLPLVAATWDARESTSNPFAWPLPSVPLPAQVPGIFPAREAFPGFAIAPDVSPLLPQAPADLPWLPGDLDPIAPPDGMPVRGNPVGLALLENAVGNGIVVGEVSDATSLDPIPGALIELVGTGRTAEADAQGRFQFAGLPAGTFNIEASQLGYFTDTTVITVIEGSPSEIRFGLRARPTDDTVDETTLEEETIVGEYQEQETSQGNFNLDLAVTPTLSSGLTSEDFTKAAVSDAGEAIEKISGANIVDGKFAVVRGLADRYITTTLNGGAISSAVPSRKAVRLDLFPTSVLSGINVDKIYAPYLTGDFGGAAIDIRTKVFPTEPVVDFKLKQDYDPSLPDQMMLSADRDLEYFGGLGEDINANEILGNDLRLITQPQPDALDAWTTLTNNRTLRPIARDSEQKQSFSMTLGNTIDLTEGVKFGFLMAGGAGGEDNYNQSRQLRPAGTFWDEEEFQRQREWNLYLAGGLQLGDYNEIRAIYFRKNITQQNVSIGRGIDDGGNTGIYGNVDAFEEIVDRYGAAADLLGNFYEIDPVEQDLEIFQLSGRHQMGERGPKLTWSLTNSDALEDRPNYSIFRTTTLDFTATEEFDAFNEGQNENFYSIVDTFTTGTAPAFDSVAEASAYFLANSIFPPAIRPTILNSLLTDLNDSYVPVDESLGTVETVALNQFFASPLSGFGPLTQRTVQSTKEKSQDQNFNLEYPIYFDEDSEDDGLTLGFGVSNIDKTRETRVGIYDLAFEWNDASGNYLGGVPSEDLYDNGLGELLAANPGLIADLLTGSRNGGPFYLDDSLGILSTPGGRPLINNVDATHAIQSHYFSSDLFFGDTFIRGGVRFETEDRRAVIVSPAPPLNELQSKFGTADGNPRPVSADEVLPAITAGSALFDGKLKVLAAWSQTTTRPAFFEWVPNETIDLSTGLIRTGNANLLNAAVESIDISLDWQVNDTTSLRASFFDKKIEDPIVELFFSAESVNYDNGDDGSIRGIELELDMAELGPFSLVSNLTYINAELNYTVDNGGIPETTSSSFPYQPEWIFNANLGYEHEPWDFGINLIYNFVGENTTVIRRRSVDPSLVLDDTHSLDLVISKGFGRDEDGGGWLIGGGIKNLWSTDNVYTYDGGGEVDGQVRNTSGVDRTYFIEAKWAF